MRKHGLRTPYCYLILAYNMPLNAADKILMLGIMFFLLTFLIEHCKINLFMFFNFKVKSLIRKGDCNQQGL